jgi:glyceraldehyde 3-phosphate dehydrogenase
VPEYFFERCCGQEFFLTRSSLGQFFKASRIVKIFSFQSNHIFARHPVSRFIPTTTGAAKAIGLVMPQLKGKLHGLSLRVPTSTVSVVDLVVDLEKPASIETVNAALRSAADGNLSGILVYCDEPLVSSDFRGNAASSIVDGPSTVVMEGKMAKILSWYDNEWGYSCRVGDLAAFMAEREL